MTLTEPIRWRAEETRRYLAQAARRAGPERDDLLALVKAVLAATGAWVLAAWSLPAAVATFAPFTSLLALHGTVYRSARESVRYVTAVVGGVLLATVIGTTAGVHAWSLAVLVAAALAVGRAQPLGPQRLQVPVTALFAFAAGGGRPGYSGHLLASAFIGVACGLVVTLLLAPAPRYHTADEAVAVLSTEVSDLLSDIADCLRETAPERYQAEEWSHRAAGLDPIAARARRTVESGEERARLNPRRVASRTGRPAPRDRFGVHYGVLSTLERVAFQTRSLTRGLCYAAESDHYPALARDFLTGYADVLAHAAQAVGSHGRLRIRGADEGRRLREAVERGRRRFAELNERLQREHLDAPGEWPLYGGLLTDAHRMIDELDEQTPTSRR